MHSQRKFEITSLAVLVGAIIAFYGLLIRPGMPWGDDWATYVQNALNLLHNNPYSATGYVVNPETDIGPSTYPPLYPLMLVLPIALWGVDFDAIRQFQLVAWAVFLVLVYLLTRRRLSCLLSLLVVAAVGFSPYFFAFKDFIASEALFLALLFLTFVLAARFEERAPNGDLPLRAGGWLGLMIGLCIATRSVGLVLVPALAAYDLLRFHRLRFATAVAIAIGVVVFVLQFAFADFLIDYLSGLAGYFFGTGLQSPAGAVSTGGGSTTVGGLQHALTGVALVGARRLSMFASEFSRFWGHGANGDVVARITSVVFFVSAIYGFTRIRKQEIMHCDVFAVVYAAALMVLPPALASARMQMPLVPLFYTYILVAVSSAGDQRGWMRRGGLAAIVTLGVLSYWHSYRNAHFREPLDGIEATDYRDMFEYISKNTEPTSTIIFDKPRTLSLYTQRRAAAIYETRKGDRLLAYMHAIGARYVLFYDDWHDGLPREKYVNDYLGNHTDEFEKQHDSGHYVLYKVKI
jgi:4-amino-4-deoxy-L-arabinose transferase-like glycosyltransferase